MVKQVTKNKALNFAEKKKLNQRVEQLKVCLEDQEQES